MALSKTLFGEHWSLAIFLLQGAGSLAALTSFFVLCHRMSRSNALAVLATACVATGPILAFDQRIYSDSLFANGLILFWTQLALSLHDSKGLNGRRQRLLGLLLAATFLVRESALLLVPLFGLWIALAPWPRSKRVRAAAALLLPTLLCASALMVWNAARMGVPCITTGRQTYLLHPLRDAHRAGLDVFAGDAALDQVVAKVDAEDGSDSSWIGRVNQRLFREHGLEAPEILDLVGDRWYGTWKSHPSFMLGQSIGRFHPALLTQPVQPIFAAKGLFRLQRGETQIRPEGRFPERLGAALRARPLMIGLQLLFAALGTLCTLALLIWAPLRAALLLRRGLQWDPEARILLAGAGLWLGTLVMHLPIQIEGGRYLGFAAPLAVLAGILGLQRARAALKGWRGQGPQ